MAEGRGIFRNNFDFLRFVLAVSVVLSHSFVLTAGNESTDLFVRLTGQLSLGSLAVDGFFIISGFLVTQSWFRSKGLMDFLERRARRIYPGFAAAVLLSAFVVGPIAAQSAWIPFAPGEVVRTLFGIVNLRWEGAYGFLHNPYAGTINRALWSIRYEALCYIGLAGLGLCACLKKRFVVPLYVLSVATSYAFLALNWWPGPKLFLALFGSPALWARLIPLYLAGTVVHLYRDRIPFNGLLALLAFWGCALGAKIPNGLSVALPTCGAYLLFWFAFHPKVDLSGWGARGDFSYGIYLVSFPIQQLVVFLFPTVRPAGLFFGTLPIALGLAMLSWRHIESRFLRRRRSQPMVVASPEITPALTP